MHFLVKAISPLLAGALYFGVVASAILLVVQIGGPAVEKMQDIVAIYQARGSLLELDSAIRDIASGGEGSASTVPVEIRRGKIYIDSGANRIYYSISTKAEIVSSKRKIGNIMFESRGNGSAVMLSMDYSNRSIQVQGDMELFPGFYDLLIANEGVAGGKTYISLRRG